MVYYSKEEERSVIEKLKQGKSVSEIIEETGMTSRAVFRIKIRAEKEKVEPEDKDEKVEISVELLKEAIEQLIKDGKFDLASKMANEIINDDSVKEAVKVIMQRKLVDIDIIEERFKMARQRGKQELRKEELTEEEKQIIRVKLISVEIASKNYDKAEKMAYELLNSEGLTREAELKVKTQLLSIAIRKTEYPLAKYRAEQMLLDNEIPNSTKHIILSRIIGMARDEGRYEYARKISNSLLGGVDINKIIAYAISNQSGKENIQENTMEIKMEDNNPQEKSHQDISKMDDERKAIYKGEVSIEDINNLTEKNKDTLEGCLFIAEACAYLNLQHLGGNCLKAYRKSNPNLEREKMKTVSKALELLKRDGLNGQRLKEEWNKIYEYLEQSRNGEEIFV